MFAPGKSTIASVNAVNVSADPETRSRGPTRSTACKSVMSCVGRSIGAVDDQVDAVQHAPDDEGPARPVPQAAEGHGDEQSCGDVCHRRRRDCRPAG